MSSVAVGALRTAGHGVHGRPWLQPLLRGPSPRGGPHHAAWEPLGLFTRRLNLNILICKVGTIPPVPEV